MGRPIREILNSDINYFEKRIKRIKEKFCTKCRCNSEKIRIPG